MIDSHTEYGHGERMDWRRQHVPASASHWGADFRPAPRSRKETSLWTVLFVLGAGIVLPIVAWVMLVEPRV